jgi:hypothetical protein
MYNSCKKLLFTGGWCSNAETCGEHESAKIYTNILVGDQQILRTSSLVLIFNFDLFITHLLVLTVNEVVG